MSHSPVPLVSCITSFLNGERFIGEAIESVLAQRYRSWELLLVDDGSTDGATAIAMSYAARYPDRVRYLEHAGRRNLGISASRNAALSAARGEYIAFLDADDVWLEDKLADQVALLEAHRDAVMLYGNTLYWYSWSGRPEDEGRDYYPPLGVSSDVVMPGDQLLELNLRGRVAVPCVNSVLLRTQVLRAAGGFEDRFTTMFEDQAWYAKMFLSGPVLVVPRSWERYRIHEDSCCAVARREGKTSDARRRYLEWLEGYLEATGKASPGIRAALRRALRPYRHPGLHRLEGLVSRVADRVTGAVGRATRPPSP